LAEEFSWETSYDFDAWVSDKYKRSLSHYITEKHTINLNVEEERRRMIENKVNTFGDHPSGLGKITRTMFARDLRRTLKKND